MTEASAQVLLGVDVGGTFTDAVVVADGRLHTAKAPTTPADQSEGVMTAIGTALERARRRAGDVEAFAHGMTVATNALLEGKGARTALIATDGFTDIVELGRQARADLYRLCAAHPSPLVGPELRFGAPERVGPDGALRTLGTVAAERLCDEVERAGAESVAVVLLHAYRHPEHERRLGEALAGRLPDVHVSLSHEVVGTFREYERAATTEVDAALSPLLAGYLRRLAGRADEADLPEPAIMQSSGGLADAELAASHAALSVLSGPAAGAAGAAYVAAAAGHPDALCFDMGGTSCDVCVIDGGRVRETAGRTVGDRPLALPMLDVHTVGAGGGSVAWRDPGGALRVGPRSAGADPGPACYGRGGREPTVTDASLLLGYLDEDSELAGGVRLRREAAAEAVGGLARAFGIGEPECAEGIVRVASAEMARALRVVSVRRGVDPRRYALLAFGGAGPMHAGAVADELGMERILCPPASGVLAALGLVVSERRRDAQRSVLRSGDDLTRDAIVADWEALAARARQALDSSQAPVRATYELRYRGQAFELPVEVPEAPATPEQLREAFEATHEEHYGYRDDQAEVELVTMRVTAALAGPDLDLEGRDADLPERPDEPAGARAAVFDGTQREAALWRGVPAQGCPLTGPAICELAEATVVVAPGWRGAAGPTGTIVLERER
ncbi:MAG TPA: hydantoinase/oxoprolinase family protein [Solirubrobacteraceae bacterium]|nr:hydantoinase/oxoprolinase family protein [Solirubrobacteraceae bacterium]